MIKIEYTSHGMELIGPPAELNLVRKSLEAVPEYMYLPTYRYPKVPVVFYRTAPGAVITKPEMLYEAVQAMRSANIQVEHKSQTPAKLAMEMTYDDFAAWAGKIVTSFPPRRYQCEAAYKILSYAYSCSEIATRAGKTLIAYLVFRYMKEFRSCQRSLVIVPNVTLVKQMKSDFACYGGGLVVSEVCGGGKEEDCADVVCGTFQSLVKRTADYFDGIGCVFLDEAHYGGSAKTIRDILALPFFKTARLRFALSGTLPKKKLEKLVLSSMFGWKIQSITAKELMDGGYIAGVEIRQLVLKYKRSPERVSRFLSIYRDAFEKAGGGKLPIAANTVLSSSLPDEEKLESCMSLAKALDDVSLALGFNAEQKMTYIEDERAGIISKMCDSVKDGNVLVLTRSVAYSKELASRLGAERITGEVAMKKRAETLSAMKSERTVLVASYACMSTGVTIPSLRCVVLAESYKSETVNLQSIGRCLARDCKDTALVYDIVDDFTECGSRYIAKQAKVKAKTYEEQRFQYKKAEISIK